ncbi:MAG TPA: hypothetical protein VGN64_03650, partial [Dyadobacter sp.]|nr:hypothetical protein [Dyadobacter sp.]
MSKHLLSSIWVILSLIPVILFGMYIFSFALNAPYNDDIALIATINHINNPESNLFHTILEQQNDHRIVFSRLATILIYWFSGEMNFRTMILFGYINLALLGYAFYLIFKSQKQPFVYFVPVTILLFSPIVQATHLWGITSFEYTLAIAFSLYSLYFLQPSKTNSWMLAMLFAVAASLSNLDGLCVLPVGLTWLIIQKRAKESLTYGGFMVVYLFLFFSNFHFSPSTASPIGANFIGNAIKGFVSFSGGIVKVISDSHAYSLSLVAGGVFITVFLVIFIRKILATSGTKDQLLPVNLMDISFLELLACAFMIALGRAAHSAESMVAIRFQIYAVSLLILLYLIVISNISNRRIKRIVGLSFISGAILLHVLSYLKYNDAIHFRNSELTADAYNYNSHAIFVHQIPEMKREDNFYRHYKFPAHLKEEVRHWKRQLKNQLVHPTISLKRQTLTDFSDSGTAPNQIRSLQIENVPDSVSDKKVYFLFFDKETDSKPVIIAG